jgi:hypothetical protein
MKNRYFSPIVIVFGLAILVIWAFSRSKNFQQDESKIIKKATIATTKLQQIIARNKELNTATSQKAESPTSELLTAERIYTEEEIKNTTEIQFNEMLKETEKRLPTMKDIKQLPSGALHHIPNVILEAGRNLGALKEVFKYHPEYEEKALPLYKTCAMAESRPTPVRALCLTNLIEISRKLNLKLDLKSFPPHIVELTKLVTDL